MNSGSLARYDIIHGRTSAAEFWICFEENDLADYCYGGTRMLAPSTSDENVLATVGRLASSESALKNQLINYAIAHFAVSDQWSGAAPAGFRESHVGGARCVIRPYKQAIYEELSKPAAEGFDAVAQPLFSSIGEALNGLAGRVKLTPDFGRFAQVSDLLAKSTEHVLGISVARGGCGGKSSYAATGVLAAMMYYQSFMEDKLTLIGAAGAMGSDILARMTGHTPDDTAICDLILNGQAEIYHDDRLIPVIHAERGKFTQPCLERGGLVVATTLGEELENSEWDLLVPGSAFLLAHNLSLPDSFAGVHLARKLMARGILILPGQVLTLGGALTSRLEWFSRQEGNDRFDKKLAHTIVSQIIEFLLSKVDEVCSTEGLTPYEAVIRLVNSQG